MSPRRLRHILRGISVFGILLSAALAAADEPPRAVPNAAFPAEDVRVLTDGATSGILRIRLQNLNRGLGRESRSASAFFLVAGSANRQPTPRVTAARYLLVTEGRIAGEMRDIPPADSNSPGKINAVRVTMLGRFRQWPVYSLAWTTEAPASVPDGRASYWQADFVDIELDLGPLPAASGEIQAAADPFGAELVVNPNVDPRYLSFPPSSEWDGALRWSGAVNAALDRGPVFRIGVYEPGMYAVDTAHLSAATSTTPAGKPAAWRLMHNGREYPMLRDIPTSPTAAAFAVAPFDGESAGSEVFWLFTGADADSTPGLELCRPATAHQPNSVTPETVRFENAQARLLDYNNHLRASPDVTRWFWSSAGDGQIADLEFNLPASFDSEASRVLDLRVFYGLANPVPIMPAAELIANGRSVQTVNLGSMQGAVSYQVPVRLLRPGKNALGIRVRYPTTTLTTNNVLFQKLLGFWEQAPRLPLGPADMFRADAPGTAPLEIRFANPGRTRGGVLVCPATSGIHALASVAPPSEEALVFRPDPLYRGPFFLADPLAAPPPPVIAPVSRFSLLDKGHAAQYLAIFHRSLGDALKPLLDRRAAQGYSVLAVDVDTVFDHFSFGRKDPAAIKSFLAYAFRYWAPPRISDVLLVGEASEYRGDPARMPDGAQEDLVPVNGSARGEGSRGDHPYTTISGIDPVSDIALGRISVATPDELTSAIAKIVAYEQAPAGDWALGAMFVTDDNDEFPRVRDAVIGHGATPTARIRRFHEADFPYVPNVKVSARRRTRDGTRALVEAWNAGTGMINYFGHGGPNLWTHERLFHLMFEVPQLRNAPRLPFLTCSSCDNAWLDYPVAPVQVSMGELLMKKPEGGAIAVFAPVGGASPFEHQTLMSHLMDSLFRRGLRTPGDSTLAAKVLYYAETMSPSLPEQYVLVGDPATKLKLPQLSGGVDIRPPVVAADRIALVEATANAGEGAGDKGVVSVRALPSGDEVLSQSVVLLGGSMRASLALSLPAGDYAIVLTCPGSDGTRNRAGRLLVARDATVPDTAAQPAPRVVAAGTATTVTLRTVNGGYPDETSASLLVNSVAADRVASGPAVAGRFLFAADADAPPGGSRNWVFGQSAGDGLVSATLGAGAARRDILITPAVAADPSTSLSVQVPRDRIWFTSPPPNTAENASVRCDVFNSGLEPVRNASVLLAEDGTAVSEPTLLQEVPPGQSRQVTVTSRAPFSAGTRNLALEVRAEEREGTGPARLQTFRFPFSAEVVPGADLQFEPGSVRVSMSANRFVTQATVMVHARLHNAGSVWVRSAALGLLVGDPATGREAQSINESNTVNLENLAPGETRDVVYRWENSRQPGTQRTWLTVNRSRSVRETNYENNTVAVPVFDLVQMTNLRISDFFVVPSAAKAGAKVHLKASVVLDGSFPDGPVDVELGLRGAFSPRKARARRTIQVCEPGRPVTVEADIEVPPGVTTAYAIVNAAREIEEFNADDNTTETPFAVIRDLPSPSGNTVDLTPYFVESSGENLDLLPGGALRMVDRTAPTRGFQPFDPAWIVAGKIQDVATTEPTKDGCWSATAYRLEASRDERTSPILVRVPVPDPLPGVQAEVYAMVPFSTDTPGGRIGSLEVKLPGEPDFRLCDVHPQALGGTDQLVLLGRATPTSGSVEISIRQPGSLGVVVAGFEFRPVAGLLVSPVLHPSGETAPVRLIVDDSGFVGADPAVSYRLGTLRENAAVEWQGWSPWASRQAELNASPGAVIQWRALLRPADAQLPGLAGARLEFNK